MRFLLWNLTREKKEGYRQISAEGRGGQTFVCVLFLVLFLGVWGRAHFTMTIFLPNFDWHVWLNDLLHLSLVAFTLATITAADSWAAWLEIREEERLKKLQASQSVPTEGVWPPAPRRE